MRTRRRSSYPVRLNKGLQIVNLDDSGSFCFINWKCLHHQCYIFKIKIFSITYVTQTTSRDPVWCRGCRVFSRLSDDPLVYDDLEPSCERCVTGGPHGDLGIPVVYVVPVIRTSSGRVLPLSRLCVVRVTYYCCYIRNQILTDKTIENLAVVKNFSILLVTM